MTLDELLASPRFLAFLDEDIRRHAVAAARAIIEEDGIPVSSRQLHSIPAIIQGAGLKGLREVAEHQASKNTHKERRAFWAKIKEILDPYNNSRLSLATAVRPLLLENGLIRDENAVQNRQERK